MASPDRVVDFPTLWVALDWIQHHCVVPDGPYKGDLFELADWQAWDLVNFYRVKPGAKPTENATAFHFRRSQIVRPQKAGKAPYTAAHVCVEGVGPALFGGWAEGGERWDCRDHGCGCGFVYEYEPGEAMGREWPTPLIQITATSEDQTDNIYDALRPMIDDGPLHDLIPKTGEAFIRLPRKGRIDVVTSNARSRLGQRVTFVPQDETGIWTPESGMVRVAETQRRGLAGMGGRSEETTNAWDPSEESVARKTAESKRTDIFRDHPTAPKSLSFANKRERRKILEHVYEGVPWINLDAIEAEAAELMETDAPQAERFFGNNLVAGSGRAFNPDRWAELHTPGHKVDGLVVLGIDGARFQDALAIIATEVETGFQWPIGIWERPENAPEGYEHPMGDVDGALQEAMDSYDVWRVYIDPGSSAGNIEPLVEKWQGLYGEEKVLRWAMNRPKQTANAVASYVDAVATGEVSHNGDERFARHIENATKRKVSAKDDDGNQMYVLAKETSDSPLKIDAAAAAVLSWEARGDAIAEGAEKTPTSTVYFT